MLALRLVAVGVTGVAAGLFSRMRNDGRIDLPVGSSQTARRVTAGIAVAVIVGFLLAAASGEVSDRWQDFKNPAIAGDTSERLSSSSGNGRYQYWDSSLEANSTDPLTGIGPGTWEFWWAENGTLPGFVRDAHGLYFEILAEQGIVGLALLLSFLGFIGVIGLGRAFASAHGSRADQAALLGGVTAFVIAAGIDWAWEQPVLPTAFMLLTAAMIGPVLVSSDGHSATGRNPLRLRLAVGLGATMVTVALAIPYLAVDRLEASRDHAGSGDLEGALDLAREAQSFQPYAATPRLQEALVLEEAGLFEEAVAPAREAAEREPTNWRTWLILARAENESGRPGAATRHFMRARSLNPRSPLFAGAG
jgi:O-antigen ligase